VRFIDAPNYADAAYAAYVPVRDSAGRVRLVVRQTGYRDLRDVPRTRVHVERVTGVLVRGAPGLLARVDDWPGRPLAGYRLRDLWILLAGERPPRPPDFTRAGILGLVLVLVPVVGGAAYLRRRALRRH
jgi:hypothetical protein